MRRLALLVPLLVAACARPPAFDQTGDGAHGGTRLLYHTTVVAEICLERAEGRVTVFFTGSFSGEPKPVTEPSLTLLVQRRGDDLTRATPASIALTGVAADGGYAEYRGESDLLREFGAGQVRIGPLTAGGVALAEAWFEWPGGMPLVGYTPEHPYNHRHMLIHELMTTPEENMAGMNGTFVEVPGELVELETLPDGTARGRLTSPDGSIAVLFDQPPAAESGTVLARGKLFLDAGAFTLRAHAAIPAPPE